MNRIVTTAGGLLAIVLLLYSSRKLREQSRLRRYGGAYLMAAFALALTISMVIYPEDAFSSALGGLKIWWEVVFPALLPFFIISEILMGLGVVAAMGVMLEPLMRPLFNVPGVGSFVMAMGLASGYPIGAILTSKLRRENQCTQVEAERLLSFTNTADPLFMIGAVAVGMFADARLGTTIAMAHYLSSITVGLCMRFYGRNQRTTPDTRGRGNIIVRAAKELTRAKAKDGRPFGQLLGDSVRNSVNSLLAIGGFIILFSVIIRVATVIGIVTILASAIAGLLSAIGISAALSHSMISGLFEITIGTQVCAQATAPLVQRVAMAGAIIAWSGLSVHAQVASIINDTDIRMGPYFIARIGHAALAFIYTLLLWNTFEVFGVTMAVPVFLTSATNTGTQFMLHRLTYMGLRAFGFLGIAVLLSALVAGLRGIKISAWRVKA